MKRKLIIMATIALIISSGAVNCSQVSRKLTWGQWFESLKARFWQKMGYTQPYRQIEQTQQLQKEAQTAAYNRQLNERRQNSWKVMGDMANVAFNPMMMLSMPVIAVVTLPLVILNGISEVFIRLAFQYPEIDQSSLGKEIRTFLSQNILEREDIYPTDTAKIHALLKKDDFLSMAAAGNSWLLFDQECDSFVENVKRSRNYKYHKNQIDLTKDKEDGASYQKIFSNLEKEIKGKKFTPQDSLEYWKEKLNTCDKSNEEQKNYCVTYEALVADSTREIETVKLENTIDKALQEYRNKLRQYLSLDIQTSLEAQDRYLTTELETTLKDKGAQDPATIACTSLRNAIRLQLNIYKKLSAAKQQKVNEAWAQSHEYLEDEKKAASKINEFSTLSESERNKRKEAAQKKIQQREEALKNQTMTTQQRNEEVRRQRKINELNKVSY